MIILLYWNIAKSVRPSFLVRIFKGSNPFIPTKKLFVIILSKSLHRLVVRTSPFHGDSTGSNPVEDIK